MKKKEVKPATETRETMSEKKAKRIALHVLGYHFTGTFIGSLKNTKLKGFIDDAEHCFEKVSERNNAVRVTCYWLGAAVLFALLATRQCLSLGDMMSVMHDWLAPTCMIMALLTGFIGCFYASSNLESRTRPGDTTKMVSKAWKPLRKRIVSAQVATKLANNIKWGHHTTSAAAEQSAIWREIEYWQYSGTELEAMLGRTLEEIATEAASAFKKAELDGTKRDQQSYRNQFGQIDRIGQQLGFEKLDWNQLNR